MKINYDANQIPKKVLLLTISLLIFILSHTPIYAHNYFHQKTKSKIKLIDYETIKQEWLNTQPKLKRYDINVLEKDDIPNILKYYDVTCTSAFSAPSYNAFKQNNLYWYLKNPLQGLLGVYFKSRPNLFKSSYPATDYQYSIEDLLKYEIAIEEAFVFWDVKQKTNEDNPNIQLIVSNIFIGQNKEEIINQYLINNNIIKGPKLIKLGCYNATPNTGLVVPLPQETFNDIPIDAIYFDDGIRIMKPQQGTIEDLLKLSNGAKNIYLFVFNTQKRAIHINLPDSLDPYKAIRDWKRVNNLYAYEGEYNKQTRNGNNLITITEPSYKEIKIPYTLTLIENTFETENKRYRITCQDTQPKRDILNTYQKDYVKWLDQCYIQYFCTYQGETIRNKLGRSSRTLYDENGKPHYYKYEKGLLVDDWYIDGNDCCPGGNRWQTRTYYQFLDTTRPPKKPEILDS